MLTLERPPKVDTNVRGRPASCRGDRQRLRRPCGGGAAGRARLSCYGSGAARCAWRRAYVHRQDGFTFDAGPTIITVPHLFEDLWRLCGLRMSDDVELRAVDPFYRLVFDDGQVMDCHADPGDMLAEVARISPGDVAGYLRFMKRSEAICATGFEALGHVPFMSLGDMVLKAPDLLRLGARRSVHGLVSQYVRHPRLRIALSFHPLFVGGNPFDTTAVYALIAHLERRWGVHFTMGGTGSLVQRTGRSDRSVRVAELRYGADVSKIIVESGVAHGVRLTSGETIAADIVVSNADAATTYRDLLPVGAPKSDGRTRRIDKARVFHEFVCLVFRRPEAL